MKNKERLANELGTTFGIQPNSPAILLLATAIDRLNQAMQYPLPDLTPNEDLPPPPEKSWQAIVKLQNQLFRQTKEALQLVKLWLSILGKTIRGAVDNPITSPAPAPASAASAPSPAVDSSAVFSLLASRLPGGQNGTASAGLKKMANRAKRR